MMTMIPKYSLAFPVLLVGAGYVLYKSYKDEEISLTGVVTGVLTGVSALLLVQTIMY